MTEYVVAILNRRTTDGRLITTLDVSRDPVPVWHINDHGYGYPLGAAHPRIDRGIAIVSVDWNADAKPFDPEITYLAAELDQVTAITNRRTIRIGGRLAGLVVRPAADWPWPKYSRDVPS